MFSCGRHCATCQPSGRCAAAFATRSLARGQSSRTTGSSETLRHANPASASVRHTGHITLRPRMCAPGFDGTQGIGKLVAGDEALQPWELYFCCLCRGDLDRIYSPATITRFTQYHYQTVDAHGLYLRQAGWRFKTVCRQTIGPAIVQHLSAVQPRVFAPSPPCCQSTMHPPNDDCYFCALRQVICERTRCSTTNMDSAPAPARNHRERCAWLSSRGAAL
mmetsp:Transcript_80465/g.130397  ORF Transcript_80465/g.130397 Transcript_80465/m.130397 type:complete len:220 (-) Transcript_80465:413-1072(-)